MPLQATSGAASYDAFGGGVAAVPTYIEDIFSTTLYTGNGSTQTITNGIDLAGKGGLLWLKARSTTGEHALFDTTRGTGTLLNTDSTNAARSETGLASFNSDGFSFANAGSTVAINFNGRTFASWTFREQPKFFDVVTWTGNGTSIQTINHSLGATPGVILIKRTDSTGDWWVYHRSLGATQYMVLNSIDVAQNTGADRWFPTSTTFAANSYFGANTNGATYVAYLFAHNAGGFGLTGTDNVISCGSYTGTGAAGNAINLGYEPQWVLIRRTDDTYDWNMFDVMRGMPVSGGSSRLSANTSAAEITGTTPIVIPTATGFSMEAGTAAFNGSGGTYIYIAIRRGPMRTPTTGTSVFAPVTQLGASFVNAGFPVDFNINTFRNISSGKAAISRLTNGNVLETNSTAAEGTVSYFNFANQNGIQDNYNSASQSTAYWNFRRAPGFFDVVCYTGTGSASQTFAHNLGVVPELMIVKCRNPLDTAFSDWPVYHKDLPDIESGPDKRELWLNLTRGSDTNRVWSTASQQTASVFKFGSSSSLLVYDYYNRSGRNYVAYLFASAPGVSKVFNYTGNGSSQTINCGFTGGARFVLIKRTDSTGDWYVWDSARGIVSGNDPRLSLNSTAAEVTTDDSVDTDSTGFVVNQLSATNINVSSATYIGIAIA